MRTVALVLPTLNGGGAERAAVNLAAAARRSRCVLVVERKVGDLVDAVGDIETRFLSEDERPAPRRARVARIADALREIDADVAVALLSPLVTTLASNRVGIPVAHWQQTPVLASMKGPLVPLRRAVLRRVVRRSSLFLSATPGMIDDWRTLGAPTGRCDVLPNGIFLPPPADGADRDPRLVVTVGRLAAEKRQDLLVDAIAELVREGRHDLRLSFVGRGERERALREQVARHGLTERVTFHGFVAEPAAVLAHAAVFALSSEFEGFGNVIVEALACGLPVVATDVPYGPRYILGDDADLGVLVPPDDSERLAAGIGQALAMEHDESARARRRARAQDFAIDRVAERFERLLDGMALPARPEAGPARP
jgi:glycosyltransferase involved in cell wall biosynthesis